MLEATAKFGICFFIGVICHTVGLGIVAAIGISFAVMLFIDLLWALPRE